MKEHLKDLTKALTPKGIENDAWIRFLSESNIKLAKGPQKKHASPGPLPTVSSPTSPTLVSALEEASTAPQVVSSPTLGLSPVVSPVLSTGTQTTLQEDSPMIGSKRPYSSIGSQNIVSGVDMEATLQPSTMVASAITQARSPTILQIASPATKVRARETPPMLVSKLPHSFEETQYTVSRGVAVDGQHFYLDMKEYGDFRVEKGNVKRRKVIVERSWDMTLQTWLLQNPNRWSETHNSWNLPESRQINKTHTIPSWDARRPTEECVAVIRGILNTVTELQLNGHIHGYLSDPENYLLSFKEMSDYGMAKPEVKVHLQFCGMEVASDSINKCQQLDMMHVLGVIFDKILEGNPLPRMWQSLYDAIKVFANKYESLKNNPQLFKRKLMIIRDHLSLRSWRKRGSFYDRLWSTLKWKWKGKEYTDDDDDDDDDEYTERVRWVFVKLQEENRNLKNEWHHVIPLDSPWRRLFEAQVIGSSAYQELRYIRSLMLHATEVDESVGSGLRYFNVEEITADSTNHEYVEVVVCECFFTFLERCHELLHESNDV